MVAKKALTADEAVVAKLDEIDAEANDELKETNDALENDADIATNEREANEALVATNEALAQLALTCSVCVNGA